VISAVTAIVAVVTAIAVVVALRSMPRSAAGDSVQDHQAV
jgi:FlaG/FlaF family flagellin (archaellin)